MSALQLSPRDNNYLTSSLLFNQFDQNEVELEVNTAVATVAVQPKLKLDGSGRAYLTGSVVLINAPTKGDILFSLPTYLTIPNAYQFPVMKLNGGIFSTSGLTVSSPSGGVTSLSLTNGGSYATTPTLSITAPGTGAVVFPHFRWKSATLASDPTGNTSYAPTNTITLTGGTASQNTIMTVSTTGVYSAVVAAGGTGGTTGTQTVTGTTGTGTKFTASVTIAGGAITAVLSILTSGSYTVNPTSLAAEPVTGASLTGATLTVRMKPLTFSSATPGNYETVPTSPVSQSASSGSGVGATFTTLWELLNFEVTESGSGYTSASTVVFTGGGSTGGGAATLNLASSSTQIQGKLAIDADENDTLFLDGVVFFVDSY